MSSSLGAIDRQPQAIVGNQREMPFFSVAPDRQALSSDIVSRMSFTGALSEAMRHCGQDDQDIAEQIHVCNGYMSRFLRSVGQQWAKRMVSFMRATNSIVPLQWIAHQMGCSVVMRDPLEIENELLKAKLAKMEKAA